MNYASSIVAYETKQNKRKQKTITLNYSPHITQYKSCYYSCRHTKHNTGS